MKIVKINDMYPYQYVVRFRFRTYVWTATGDLIPIKKLKEDKNGLGTVHNQ